MYGQTGYRTRDFRRMWSLGSLHVVAILVLVVTTFLLTGCEALVGEAADGSRHFKCSQGRP